jgi:hypothetical protein
MSFAPGAGAVMQAVDMAFVDDDRGDGDGDGDGDARHVCDRSNGLMRHVTW